MIAPTPYFSDRGCHVRIYEEAKALKARGHEVVIVTYHLGRDMDDIPVVRIPNIPWYRKQSAGPSWHKPYLDILLLYRALVTARKFKPDIIHAHLHEGAFLAAIAKRSFKAPIVFDCQGSLTGELLDHGFMKKGGFLHKLFSGLEAWITKQADYIITSSTPTADLLRREYPEVTQRINPLTDAVDTDIFKPLARDENLLDKLGIPKGKTLIVYLGAMTEYQGVDLLLDVLKKLTEKRDDFHVLIMGYPEEDYVAKASKLELTQHVTFTGKLDYADAPYFLSQGDIAVSPKLSTTEANGKLLNYMACGLPVVAFDNPVNRELLFDAGLFAKALDVNDFYAKICQLLDDSGLRSGLSGLARQIAVENHSWLQRIDVLEGCYYQIKH